MSATEPLGGTGQGLCYDTRLTDELSAALTGAAGAVGALGDALPSHSPPVFGATAGAGRLAAALEVALGSLREQCFQLEAEFRRLAGSVDAAGASLAEVDQRFGGRIGAL